MATEIKNKLFRKLMKTEGLEKVILVKADGFFYITSEDGAMYDIIYNLPQSTIYLNSFNHQSAEQWVADIKNLFTI